jgi:hypothetical protein
MFRQFDSSKNKNYNFLQGNTKYHADLVPWGGKQQPERSLSVRKKNSGYGVDTPSYFSLR